MNKLSERITILTTTHLKASAHRLEPGYPGNHDRSNTSTSLIDFMISELYKSLDCYDIRHIISIDHDPSDRMSCDYLDNLNILATKYPNIEIIVTTTGIRDSIFNLIKSVQTDYYLWFEHDWQFMVNPNLRELIEIFDTNDDINYIRFNKRANIHMNCDTKLEQRNINVFNQNITLLATDGWSNNPYIARVSIWNTWFEYLNDTSTRKYVTIEQELQSYYRTHIERDGWHNAVKHWGVYIYGKFNDPKRVHHLNGKNL